MNEQNDILFDRYDALTFDDVVVVPGYSETLPDAVDTSSVFAADIVLSVPLVSAANTELVSTASGSVSE